MGKYYNVDEVLLRGQRIRKDEIPHIKGTIVMVLDNGVRKMAVDVTSPSEFQEFHKQYSSGHWLSYDIYLFQPQ